MDKCIILCGHRYPHNIAEEEKKRYAKEKLLFEGSSDMWH
jgi:hypothetical protein